MTRDELIIAKRRLVGRMVAAYLKRHPRLTHLRADLRSAGMIGLIQGIDRLSDSIQDADKYLAKCILGALANCVANENTIRIPARTRGRAKKAGRPIPSIFCRPLPEKLVDSRLGDPLNAVLECCRDDRERLIIRMLAAGHTQQQVAASIRVNQSRISQILKAIEQRYVSDDPGSDELPATCARKIGPSTICGCGQPVRFANENRCEDCWSLDQQRFHGRSQRVNTTAA